MATKGLSRKFWPNGAPGKHLRTRLFGGDRRRCEPLIAPEMQMQHPLDPRKPLALLPEHGMYAVDPAVQLSHPLVDPVHADIQIAS